MTPYERLRLEVATILDEADNTWQHGIGASGYDPNGPPLWLVDALTRNGFALIKTLDGPPPETCWHKVIQSVPVRAKYKLPEWMRICISCDATLDDEFLDSRVWDYDIDHNVWVHVPQKGPKRTYDHTQDVPPHTHGGTDAPECTTCIPFSQTVQIPWPEIVGFRVGPPGDQLLFDPHEVEIIFRRR